MPLSARAVELLELLPLRADGGTVFGLTSASVDALFRKAKKRAMIEDGTFHDTRHLAITRLAKKLGVLHQIQPFAAECVAKLPHQQHQQVLGPLAMKFARGPADGVERRLGADGRPPGPSDAADLLQRECRRYRYTS